MEIIRGKRREREEEKRTWKEAIKQEAKRRGREKKESQ